MIGLTQTVKGLQALLKSCEEWANKKGLQWNPIKSQILRMYAARAGQEDDIKLYGVLLQFAEVVEYLGLLLTHEGFKGKDRAELLDKCTVALQ